MRNKLAFHLALLLGTLPLSAIAAQATHETAIAAMPLDQALDTFARQTGLQVVYTPDAVHALRSKAVPAGLDAKGQLHALLQGTGLDYRFVTASTVTLVPAPKDDKSAAASSRAGSLPPIDEADGSPRDLAPVSVQANTVDTLAPSAPPLEATQPTSVIDERFIRDGLRFNANFDDIIKYAPSVTVTSPEGPGMGKNEGISIRGFQDGQFNITFDGIPFGDASDLHHTTSAYFNNHVLGQAEIDRGPGGGSTIGNATFGGTVGLRSRDPSAVDGVTLYTTVGSWNTVAGGVSADETLGNTRIFADLSKEKSDTYLKGTDDKREHAFIKTITALSSNTTLTFVSSYNREHQNTVQGATKQEMDEFGWRYGLGNDPTLQSYKGYNNAAYYSSFTYVGLATQLGEWSIDNKAYYNSFDHWARKTTDASDNNPADNGVTLYNAAGKKVSTLKNDVPGKLADSGFHSFGDVLRFERELGPGQLQTGAWLERSQDARYQYPLDLTTGAETGTKYGSKYNYILRDRTDTFQPYVQYDWSLTDALTLSPGVRYSTVTRQMNAPISKSNAQVSQYNSANYNAMLPSLSLHDSFSDQWTGYAQVAKGFLAPPIDVVELVGSKKLDPETTTNYQLGTAFANRGLTFGADVYYIDFKNYLATTLVNTDEGQESTYLNAGGAIYKGAEVEGTWAMTRTLSLYGNATYNKATYKNTSTQIAGTPKVTAALGLLYSSPLGYYGSLMTKFIGKQYGSDNATNDAGNTVFVNDNRLAAYVSTDAAFGYRSADGGPTGKGWSVSMDVNNLFNVHKLIGYAGTQSVSGDALYWGLPGRGVFLDLSLKL
ncbi:TonB-dependent receptor domain-containing protein [Luteibacter aegosomatissinici]|uniref:TonB-dependent receptor domain-containing protein n=1 Tax=Luteibacter aegosomatissinici TaxID=2911539 RepID=UPI001FFB066F|nr:TonB-dependent receptor [Luteibacter aegosomatissinici]UPG92600.1 TonB-dependent receptor [Luteibacter aegosomatissinici]